MTASDMLAELDVPPEAPPKRHQIATIKYSHDAMVDVVIANPGIRQREIAAMFGRSESWISIIFCSDAFQARLAARKAEAVDPLIQEELEARLKATFRKSLEVIADKLASPNVSDDLAIKAAALGAKALGFGLPSAPQVVNVFSEDRLSRLAERLTELNRPPAIDVESRTLP